LADWTLLARAKSLASRGGKMVLLNPMPETQNVLEITGIPSMVPVYSYLESAETILMTP